MFKQITFILAMVLCSTLAMASILTQEFEVKLKEAPDDSTALALIRDYVTRTTDMEDLRYFQNYWLRFDPQGCADYFEALYEQNPQDEKYYYLMARSQDDEDFTFAAGRQLVRKHPDFEYGYRLLLSFYQQNLFTTPGPKHPDAQAIMKKYDYKGNKKYFQQYLKRFPDNENAMYLALNQLVWEKKVKDANKLLAEALDKNVSWLTWQFYTSFYLKTGQLDLLQAYLRRMVDTSQLTMNMSPDEKESQFEQAYLTTLLIGEAYSDIIDYVQTNTHVLNDPYNQQTYLIACAEKGEVDKAFGILNTLAEAESDLYQWLTTDPSLASLKGDPRWAPILARFKTTWEAGVDKRRVDVLAKEINRPAPLWELEDAFGDTIRLADLKGKVVILDFWATWCGPCKQAMPLLDNWLKTKMPSGVRVFSINVWERNPEKVLPFMAENGYAMTLLWGNEEVARQYKVEGIPYLCVIDQEGIIRFEETGYVPELEENLTFWVEDLLSETEESK